MNDVPVDFRVTLLRNAPNARAVHSSKAVGEPPFHLGASVLFAIKDAVYACRAQSGACFVLWCHVIAAGDTCLCAPVPEVVSEAGGDQWSPQYRLQI